MKIRHFVLYLVTKWRIFILLNPCIFAANGHFSKQTSDLAFINHALLKQYMTLGLGIFLIFGAKFMTSFSRQNIEIQKTKTIRFVRIVCSMFARNFVREG